MQVSQAVLDRIKIASTIISVIDYHAFEVVGPLSALLFPAPEPALFDVQDVLFAKRDLLIRARERMRQADEALKLEAADDHQYRDARDQAMIAIRRALHDAIGVLHAACDVSVLARYNLDAAIPRSPERLQEYAEEVIRRMRAQPSVDDSPYGFQINLSEFADQIDTELVPLIVVMEDIRREIRELQEALQARNDAVAAFDTTYESVAALVTAYFTLAGREDLATRVRPTNNRREGVPDPEDLAEPSVIDLDASAR